MKKRLNPTQILLHELPEEGRFYEYSQDSAELTPILKDLIGSNPYSVRLSVKPIGNAFDVQGEVKTNLNLQCALCAMDFAFPINEKFHEVVVIQEPLEKGDQNVKVNHSSEFDWTQPEGVYLEKAVFEVGSFVHELVGISEPIRPLGKPDCDKACENRKVDLQRDWLSIDPKEPVSVKNNPFAVLEKVKLKS